MRAVRWYRLSGVALGGAIALGAAALLACGHYRIWSLRDYALYREITGHYSIGPDLWFGRIQPGQDVEVLIAQSDPHRVRRYGRWVEVVYAAGGPRAGPGLLFESVTLLAKDGKLVVAGAWSCTWQRVFFDTLSPDEHADWNIAMMLQLTHNEAK